ncbi:uncharacterized protein BDR25DRAFT_346844 [Lindgomyces ingoldianus]|uniref:Uncharacterized protein n=1 Tax=Lindgomyces ingoldianus TaxID=673940 RepID=A0ACB6QDG6_9PLEO|nr:uncharacterized protein BDR25DRAFT_346844 [Lindgomyces ingoldianus]KAF2464167.1 hypothetical protein BDR25DRAFT_346844 [Lindgomyces ingoldianus]
MSVAEPEDGNPSEDHQHLSIPSGGADPRRSCSSVASSTYTLIEEDPDIIKHPAAIHRRRTQVAVVSLSWWDCVKGFFLGPGKVKPKLTATAEIADLEDADEKMFDDKTECPFFLTVSVFPCQGSDVVERQEGRCVLDTACLQGNIISIEFAHRLGFTQFKSLKPRERNGGIVASGNIHNVSGAIHVSWYHCTSSKVFRNMRFLVSESAPVDMVIGTHSIVRHQLISPPNLFIDIENEPDPDRDELKGAVVQKDGEVHAARQALQEAMNTPQYAQLEKQLEMKKEELRVANWMVDLYDADVWLCELKKKPKSATQVEKRFHEAVEFEGGEKDEKKKVERALQELITYRNPEQRSTPKEEINGAEAILASNSNIRAS